MKIESKRKKLFIMIAIYAIVFAIINTIINLPLNLQFDQFIIAEFLAIILLANGIFFIANISSIQLYESYFIINFPLLKQQFEIQYDQISYDEKNASVLFLKTNENRVFAIRKFEFRNYSELRDIICSRSSFSKINVFSNFKKGILSYAVAFVVVTAIYFAYKL